MKATAKKIIPGQPSTVVAVKMLKGVFVGRGREGERGRGRIEGKGGKEGGEGEKGGKDYCFFNDWSLFPW